LDAYQSAARFIAQQDFDLCSLPEVFSDSVQMLREEALLMRLILSILGSEQEFDERQAGMTFSDGRISVHSAVCETAT
jgi:hypothetical protein